MAGRTVLLVVSFLFLSAGGASLTASSHGDGGDTVSAYPVKWDIDNINTVSAYPVKWDIDNGDVVAPSPSPSHGEHMHWLKVKTGMLFLERSLHPGVVLPRGTKLGSQQARPEGDPAAPPFGIKHLGDILAVYKIAHGSDMAAQVADTLRFCGEAASHDNAEPQTCATSRQVATDFAARVIGKSRAISSVIHGPTEPVNYAVARISRLRNGGAVVVCHPLAYPYTVYFCHRPAGVHAVNVELTGERGLGTTALAVCHSDTTGWDGAYFELLGGIRGEAICHYMPMGYLLFVAA